ncbi:exodeoxyribonuclease VII small subunit [Ectothiorhodospiraceae bacterium BW-2]|nr:exodeoxyribonuclease VII small subunit [Ectothiorhodospiraceae bacterium BW-2]
MTEQNETQTFAHQFEKDLAELEQLVQRMEQGNQPLEEALADFERGITLSRHCQQILQQAEQRVQILLQQRGSEELRDFLQPEQRP